MRKHVLVLGAGFGGLATAIELRKLLPKDFSITLVDKKDKFWMGSAHLLLMVGERKTPEEFVKPLDAVERGGIKFVNEEILQIDPVNRRVRSANKILEAEYMVVALGAELAPEEIRGFKEYAYNLYELDGAYKLQSLLNIINEGRIVVLISRTPFKCPAAPYEAAFLLDTFMRRRNIRDKVTIEIYTPEPQPMPVAGKAVGEAVEEMLRQRSIGYHRQQMVISIDGASRTIVFERGEVSYDVLIGIPPHRAPKVVKEAGLTDSTGWVPVDPYTLKTGFENVFAIGDVASVKLKNGMFLPKAGVFAESQGMVVARNIAAEVLGVADKALFDGRGYCYLDVGDGRAAFASGEFFAEPSPKIKLETPSERYRFEKIQLERIRLESWFTSL